jgi:hypothetical protein
VAQWEDDLRAVVEHRGAALVARARALVPPDDDAHRAVELTADAFAAAFRRGGRRATGEQGTVRLLDDDELDALAAQVGRERLARASRDVGDPPRDAAAPPVPAPDDGPSDELTALLPEVVARVRVARRRGRRRALLGSAAVVVMAALATTAAATRPWDGPAPAPTRYAGACGTTLPSGKSLLRVRYNSDWAGQRTIVADQSWDAEFEAELDPGSAPDPTKPGPLDALTPEVVLVRGGKVVALGVSTGEKSQDGDGDALPAPRFSDLAAGSPAYVSVRFAACDGGDLAAGTYQARLFATTDDGSAHMVSDAATLTVVPTVPDGYQPTWLAGSPLACGEKADDFVLRAHALAPDRIDPAGSGVYDDGFAVLLKNGSTKPLTLRLPRRATVAWVQHGRIVGVGPDERAARTTTVGAGRVVQVPARPWKTTDYCTASADGAKPGHLAPGTYEAIVYTRVPAADPADPDGWVVDDWRGNDIAVHRDGSASLVGVEG